MLAPGVGVTAGRFTTPTTRTAAAPARASAGSSAMPFFTSGLYALEPIREADSDFREQAFLGQVAEMFAVSRTALATGDLTPARACMSEGPLSMLTAMISQHRQAASTGPGGWPAASRANPAPALDGWPEASAPSVASAVKDPPAQRVAAPATHLDEIEALSAEPARSFQRVRLRLTAIPHVNGELAAGAGFGEVPTVERWSVARWAVSDDLEGERHRCRNCGAPVDAALGTRCEYCGTAVPVFKRTWGPWFVESIAPEAI